MNATSYDVLVKRARIADEIREAAGVDHLTWNRICREVRLRVDKGHGLPNGRGSEARAIAISMAASDELHDERTPARDDVVEYLRRNGCTSRETGASQSAIASDAGRTPTSIYNAVARLYEAGIIRKTYGQGAVIWLRNT